MHLGGMVTEAHHFALAPDRCSHTQDRVADTIVPCKDKVVLDVLWRILRELLDSMATPRDRTVAKFEDLSLIMGCAERVMTAEKSTLLQLRCGWRVGTDTTLRTTVFKAVDQKFIEPLMRALALAVESRQPKVTTDALRVLRTALERVRGPDEQTREAASKIDKLETFNREQFDAASGVEQLDDVFSHVHKGTDPEVVAELLQLVLSLIAFRQHTTSYRLLEGILGVLTKNAATIWEWSHLPIPEARVKAEAAYVARIAACTTLRAMILESDSGTAESVQKYALDSGHFVWHFYYAVESAAGSEELGARRLPQELYPEAVPTAWLDDVMGRAAFGQYAAAWTAAALRSRAASRDLLALLCNRNTAASGVVCRSLPEGILNVTLRVSRPAPKDGSDGLTLACTTDHSWWDINRAAKPKTKADKAAADTKVKRVWFGANVNSTKPVEPRRDRMNFSVLWQTILTACSNVQNLWTATALWELRYALFEQVEGLRLGGLVKKAGGAAQRSQSVATSTDGHTWQWLHHSVSYGSLDRHVQVGGYFLPFLLDKLDADDGDLPGDELPSGDAKLRVCNELARSCAVESHPNVRLQCLRALKLLFGHNFSGESAVEAVPYLLRVVADGAAAGHEASQIVYDEDDDEDGGDLAWHMSWRQEALKALQATLIDTKCALIFNEYGGNEILLTMLLGCTSVPDDDPRLAAPVEVAHSSIGVPDPVLFGRREALLSRSDEADLVAQALTSAAASCPAVCRTLCRSGNLDMMQLALMQRSFPAVAARVLHLLRMVLPHSPLTLPTLEGRGFFLAVLYSASVTKNEVGTATLLAETAELLQETHISRFVSERGDVSSWQDEELTDGSSLSALLPSSMVHVFRTHSAAEVAAIFNAEDHVSAQAIWNTAMRNRLLGALQAHLAKQLSWLAGEPAEVPVRTVSSASTVFSGHVPAICSPSDDYRPLAVKYPELDEEPRVAGVFLRLYASGAAESIDVRSFLPALAAAVDDWTNDLNMAAAAVFVKPDGPIAGTALQRTESSESVSGAAEGKGDEDAPVGSPDAAASPPDEAEKRSAVDEYRIAHLRCRLGFASLIVAGKKVHGRMEMPDEVLSACLSVLELVGGQVDADVDDALPAALLLTGSPGVVPAGMDPAEWQMQRGWLVPTSFAAEELFVQLADKESLLVLAIRTLSEFGFGEPAAVKAVVAAAWKLLSTPREESRTDFPALSASEEESPAPASSVSQASMELPARRRLLLSRPVFAALLDALDRAATEYGNDLFSSVESLLSLVLRLGRVDYEDLRAGGDGVEVPTPAIGCKSWLPNAQRSSVLVQRLAQDPALRKPILDHGGVVFLCQSAICRAVDSEDAEEGDDADDVADAVEAVRQSALACIAVLAGARDDALAATSDAMTKETFALLRTLLTPGIVKQLSDKDCDAAAVLELLRGTKVETPLVHWEPAMLARLQWMLAHCAASVDSQASEARTWTLDSLLAKEAYRELYSGSLGDELIVEDVFVSSYIELPDILAITDPTPEQMVSGLLAAIASECRENREPAEETVAPLMRTRELAYLAMLVPAAACLVERVPSMIPLASSLDTLADVLGLIGRYRRARSGAGEVAEESRRDEDMVVHSALRICAALSRIPAGAAAVSQHALHGIHMFAREAGISAPTGGDSPGADGAGGAGGAAGRRTAARRASAVHRDAAAAASTRILALRAIAHIARNAPLCRETILFQGIVTTLLSVAFSAENNSGEALARDPQPSQTLAVKGLVAAAGAVASFRTPDAADKLKDALSHDAMKPSEAVNAAGWGAGDIVESSVASYISTCLFPLFSSDARDRRILHGGFADPSGVIRSFRKDVAEPDLIWNAAIRGDVDAILTGENEILDKRLREAGHAAVPFPWDGLQARVKRPALERALYVGDVFVREYNRKPNFAVADAATFLAALMDYEAGAVEAARGKDSSSEESERATSVWSAVANVLENHPDLAGSEPIVSNARLFSATFERDVPRGVQAAALAVLEHLSHSEGAVQAFTDALAFVPRILMCVFFFRPSDPDASEIAAAAVDDGRPPPLAAALKIVADFTKRSNALERATLACGAVLLLLKLLIIPSDKGDRRAVRATSLSAAALLSRLALDEEVGATVKDTLSGIVLPAVVGALELRPPEIVAFFAADHEDETSGRKWDADARAAVTAFLNDQCHALEAALEDAGIEWDGHDLYSKDAVEAFIKKQQPDGDEDESDGGGSAKMDEGEGSPKDDGDGDGGGDDEGAAGGAGGEADDEEASREAGDGGGAADGGDSAAGDAADGGESKLTTKQSVEL